MSTRARHASVRRAWPVWRLRPASLLLTAVLCTGCDYVVIEGRLGGDDCDSLRIAFWSSLGQPIRTTDYHDARLYTFTDYHSDGSYHTYYYIQSVYGLQCTHETGRASDIDPDA